MKSLALILLFIISTSSSLKIQEPSCEKTTDSFRITPNSIYIVGGEDIVVSGPCFQHADHIELSFAGSQKTTKCSFIDSSKAICKVPTLELSGQTQVKMSINKKEFTSEITVLNFEQEPLSGLELYYEEKDLTEVYIEIDFESSKTHMVFYVSSSGKKVMLGSAKTGSNRINLGLIKKHLERSFANSTLGFIAIGELTVENALVMTRWLSVTPIYTLGCIGLPGCKLWYRLQPDTKSIMDKLPPCWRILPLKPDGSFPDGFGEFEMDSSCNPGNPSSCAFFHNTAKGCFRSKEPVDGHGQQCCYGADNSLLVGPPGGGTLDMGHVSKPIEHALRDVVPYLICAKLANRIDLYYDKRPSDDGSRWEPTQ